MCTSISPETPEDSGLPETVRRDSRPRGPLGKAEISWHTRPGAGHNQMERRGATDVARAPLVLVTDYLHRLAGPTAARTDAELLGAYASGRDEDAFAALLSRHGPMVLGVCRRTLGPT